MTCFTSATTSCGLRTALISLLLAACTGQGHRCIEHERTIEHGIYGEVVYRQLEGGDTPLYQVPVALTQTDRQAMTETETNEDGLYEFALPSNMQPQSFTLSSTFANAPTHEVQLTDLARRDLVVEEGQVFWDEQRLGECP